MSTSAFDILSSEIEPGLSIIEASAGTGKTHALSHLVPRLLLEGTVSSLSEILLVTYTNDAARELSNRVRGVLEKLHAPPGPEEDEALAGLRTKFKDQLGPIIEKALLEIDRLGVSTIHSFCQRTLQTEGALCGLPVLPELIPSSDELIEQALHDLWCAQLASHPELARIALEEQWQPSADALLVRKALNGAALKFVPEPDTFEPARLAGAPSLPPKHQESCRDLAEFIKKDGIKWNGSGADQATREAHLRAFTEAQSLLDHEFRAAVAWVMALPDHVAGNSTAGKQLKKEAEKLSAVQEARELLTKIKKLYWNWQAYAVAEVRVQVEKALKENRQITYDGLIGTLHAALEGTTSEKLVQSLRARYKVALVDESQDTDHRQYAIFKKIFLGSEGHRLVMIGDPKQAIYAFRGADVNTYLAARGEARTIYSLNKTYRQPGSLVEAINALFSRSGSLLKEKLVFEEASSGLPGDLRLSDPANPGNARMEFWIVHDDDADLYSNETNRNKRIAGAVAAEVVRLLTNGAQLVATGAEGAVTSRELEPRDFAILVSDHWQAEAMVNALKERALPVVQAGTGDVMASEEAAELLLLLRALDDPRRAGLRYAAMATRLLGFNSATLRDCRQDPVKDEEVLAKFVRWQQLLLSYGIGSALERIDLEQEISARLSATEKGERRITNFRQLTGLLQEAAAELGQHSGHLLRWLSQEVAGASSRTDLDNRQLQLESDEAAVKIVTMHASKGLQYKLVFCPFLLNSKALKSIGTYTPEAGKLQLIQRELDKSLDMELVRADLEDRLRLAYVAITRAQVHLWIYGGPICGKAPASALDWLLGNEPFDEGWCKRAGGPGRGDRHWQGLEALVAARNAQALITVKQPPEPTLLKWQPSQDATPQIASLPEPPIPGVWGITSFSGLTKEKSRHGELEISAALTAVPQSAIPEPESPMHLAQGGTRVGTAIHDFLETWDFSKPDPKAVSEHLQRYGFKAGQPEEQPFDAAVFGMLEQLRGALLPGLDCTIAQACPLAEASEWAFHLPIKTGLGGRSLAEAFRKDGQEEYAALLATLPAEELNGYLNGFLDRLALHKGQWGVIDWKTNKLKGYSPEQLKVCALESHYWLQTHLYLVALRRYLGSGVPIAGAWLVFLRGIAAGTGAGLLHIQPSASLMNDLDALFARP